MNDKKYRDVSEKDAHWICSSCHTHFTSPKQDDDGIMVCPACKSYQIEMS